MPSYLLIVTCSMPNSSTPTKEGYYEFEPSDWRFAQGTAGQPTPGGNNNNQWPDPPSGRSALAAELGSTLSLMLYVNAHRPDLEPFSSAENYEWGEVDFSPDQPGQADSPLDESTANAWRAGFSGAPAIRVDRPNGAWLSWQTAFLADIANEGDWTLSVKIHTTVPDRNNPDKNFWFRLDPRMCVGEDCTP